MPVVVCPASWWPAPVPDPELLSRDELPASADVPFELPQLRANPAREAATIKGIEVRMVIIGSTVLLQL
jgi:hypothetical protein